MPSGRTRLRRTCMKPRAAAVAFILGGFWITAATGTCTEPPVTVRPENLVWFSVPNNPELQGAWVVGGEQKAGPYLLRVRLAVGGRIPPHTHPDERNSTVLSGTIYVGFGEGFDEARVVEVPTGGVYVAPANVPHYVWAKDGEAIYQEGGVGPSATVPVKR